MNSESLISKYEKMLSDKDTYSLTGNMDIVSNEELYHYIVKVDYQKGGYYKASLKSSEEGHEQIILKNMNGVYVITPSLNKSFKFQSEWPDNSSQAYILESLLKDLKNDSNVVFEEKEDKYILSSTVNYPNNSNLTSQKITFNKDILPETVEVYDKNGNISITFNISKIDFDIDFTDNYFDVEESASSEDEVNNANASIEEIVYPMYLPEGTRFKSEETVKNNDSERVILTFTGDKSFILIEEVAKKEKEFEVMSTSGELVFYENLLGNLSESSLNWSQNGKDYYLIGDNLTHEELLKVASSTSVVSLTK